MSLLWSSHDTPSYRNAVSSLASALGSADTAHGRHPGSTPLVESCVWGRRDKGTGTMGFVWREAKGAGKDEIPRTSPGTEARSPSPVPQSKDVRVGVSGRQTLLEKGRVPWPYACREKYGKNVTLSVRHGGLGLPHQAWLEDRQHGSHPRPAEPGSGVQPGSQVCVWKLGSWALEQCFLSEEFFSPPRAEKTKAFM